MTSAHRRLSSDEDGIGAWNTCRANICATLEQLLVGIQQDVSEAIIGGRCTSCFASFYVTEDRSPRFWASRGLVRGVEGLLVASCHHEAPVANP
jgi:hypothetical protein